MKFFRHPGPLGLLLGFLVVLTSLQGCRGKRSDLGEVDWKHANSREYVATWALEGNPVIAVSVSYHGKAPLLPFDGPQPNYEWRTRDTDFYSCELRNLTDHPIRLNEVTAEMEKTDNKVAPAKGRDYIVARWGSDTIEPGKSLRRRNTWVWGKGTSNTLHKYFRAAILDNDEAPTPFAFEVRTSYQR